MSMPFPHPEHAGGASTPHGPDGPGAGNTGMFGKFYARVGKTVDCKGDTSKTVRSRRS